MDNYTTKISQLQKEATAYKKKGNIKKAINLLKKSLKLIQKSSVGFDHYSFTKIIPYMQLAGKYSKLETFTHKKIIPIMKINNQAAFSHQNKQIQDAYFNLKLYYIYDKMRLCAKREGNLTDKVKFSNLSKESYNTYIELLNTGEESKSNEDLELFEDLFGPDRSNWPKSVKRMLNTN